MFEIIIPNQGILKQECDLKSQNNGDLSVHCSKFILCVSNQSTQKTVESVKFHTVLIRLSKWILCSTQYDNISSFILLLEFDQLLGVQMGGSHSFHIFLSNVKQRKSLIITWSSDSYVTYYVSPISILAWTEELSFDSSITCLLLLLWYAYKVWIVVDCLNILLIFGNES